MLICILCNCNIHKMDPPASPRRPLVIDMTLDINDDASECVKRVVDTIFTRICPIDLVSSDDDEDHVAFASPKEGTASQ